MTESLQRNQWTDHYIIKDRTRYIEVPAGFRKIIVSIKYERKYK